MFEITYFEISTSPVHSWLKLNDRIIEGIPTYPVTQSFPVEIVIQISAYDVTWGKTVTKAFLTIINQPPVIKSDYSLTKCSKIGKRFYY